MKISSEVTAAAMPREAAPLAPQEARPASPAAELAAIDKLQEEKKAELAPEQTQVAVAEINHSLQMAAIGVRFEFDAEANTMVTRVVDVASGDLIRQTPTEEVLRISKAIDTSMQGLLLKDKA